MESIVDCIIDSVLALRDMFLKEMGYQVLQVNVKKSVKGSDSALSSQNGNNSHVVKSLKAPVVRKSKLVVVDLAGSERIDKSGWGML